MMAPVKKLTLGPFGWRYLGGYLEAPKESSNVALDFMANGLKIRWRPGKSTMYAWEKVASLNVEGPDDAATRLRVTADRLDSLLKQYRKRLDRIAFLTIGLTDGDAVFMATGQGPEQLRSKISPYLSMPGSPVPEQATRNGELTTGGRNVLLGCGGLLVLLIGIGVSKMVGVGSHTAIHVSAQKDVPTVAIRPTSNPPSAAPVVSAASTRSATATPVTTVAHSPHDLTPQNVLISYRDNHETDAYAADDPTVTIDADGTVNLTTWPGAADNESYELKTVAGTALVASRAIFDWYPSATSLHVVLKANFVDSYGKSSVEDALILDLTSATASLFDYSGLPGRVLDDASIMYCDSDSYTIFYPIWNKLSSQDKGCMTQAVK